MAGWGPELAVLLGLVEGLTEFLPVSSTGHLILIGHLLGFTGAVAASVETSIQLGAILAVIAYERKKLSSFLSQAIQEQAMFRSYLIARSDFKWGKIYSRSAEIHRNLWFLIGLVVAFLPAAVLGFLGHRWIEAHLFNPHTVALALIGGGVIILVVEARPRRVRFSQLDQIGVKTALWVGIAQCLSLIPGTSRSGATIIGGLLVGMDRKIATEYSFFLALPTMIAATCYKMVNSAELLTRADFVALGLGLVVSFLVAWAVIAAFLTFVQRHTLRAFAYYRLLLGMAVLLVFG